MTVSMRKTWLVAGIAAIVVLVLGYAWIDGGREPLRTISEPIAVPGAAR
ncbi:MAG: hypothetical protein JF595_11695 [Sphingomonadales bacterium]|nr:hypothetical protein [Sphingomonadales bacterium]